MGLYIGPTDPTRESTNELAESKVEARVKCVLEESAVTDLGDHLTPLRHDVLSTRVKTSVECLSWVFLQTEFPTWSTPFAGSRQRHEPPHVPKDRVARAARDAHAELSHLDSMNQN
jgi:hypothetical protein